MGELLWLSHAVCRFEIYMTRGKAGALALVNSGSSPFLLIRFRILPAHIPSHLLGLSLEDGFHLSFDLPTYNTTSKKLRSGGVYSRGRVTEARDAGEWRKAGEGAGLGC